jgi:endonuclease YncB( thermonuclease family)
MGPALDGRPVDMLRICVMRRVLHIVLLSALLLGVGAPAWAQDELRGRATVVSADTLEVSGARLRLYGIIGPSKDQKCRAGALPWLCGNAAYNHLVEQVADKIVTCVDKGLTQDKTRTALCKADGRDLSYVQVRNGWANADPVTGTGYQSAEQAARGTKAGFWKK